MLNHRSDSVSARPQIFARIKFGRVFSQEFPDFSSQSQSEVRIDVDLTNTVFGGLSYHVFRHALSAGDVTSVLIALIYELFQNCRSSVKHQRCIRYELVDFF